MSRTWFSLLWLLPLTVHAGQGGWNASQAGVTLGYRGQMVNSSPFVAPATQGVRLEHKITVVYWRYVIEGPLDAGLRVKLCTVQRCADIEGGSGQTETFRGLPANSEFRFAYYVDGRGRIDRPIDVRRIDIAVNYE